MAKVIRVDHIAFAVRNLEESRRALEQNYGAKFLAMAENPLQKYVVATFQFGENLISLLQATDESSFVAKFVEERGEGVQHIGLEVDNIEEFVANLESKGVRVPVKQMTGDGRKEVLVGPRSGFGVVMQIIEWKDGPDVPLEQRIERSTRYISLGGG